MSVVIDGTSGITFPDSSSQSAAAASGYPAQAWVNFNGTGTVVIRDDGGVSSITDNGTGYYSVNLSPSLASANYASVGTSSGPTNGGLGVVHVNKAGALTSNSAPTTSSFTLITCNWNGPLYDGEYNNAGVLI